MLLRATVDHTPVLLRATDMQLNVKMHVPHRLKRVRCEANYQHAPSVLYSTNIKENERICTDLPWANRMQCLRAECKYLP